MKNKYFILFLLILSACSAERDNILSKSYHNTTAYYNPYFIVREDHSKVVEDILNSTEDNYYDILTLFPEFDTLAIQSNKEALENDVKLSSKVIDWHKNSKWVASGYIQLGNTFYYLRNFEKSNTALRLAYAKAESEEVKQLALIRLLRTYLDAKEETNLSAVDAVIEREIEFDSTRKGGTNLKKYLIAKSILAQREENYKAMYKYMSGLPSLLKKKDNPARMYYILGQLAEKNGDLEKAEKYFRKCDKSNPSYVLGFNAKLRYSSISQLSDEKGIEKRRKYFKKLLRDRKNAEFRDKIYFEWALFEIKNEQLNEALKLLKLGAKEQSSSQMQKALIFKTQADIYYDSLENIVSASSYYDSTVTVLPKKVDFYESTQTLQEILARFVVHYKEKNLQDSLLNLSQMSETERNKVIDKKIAEVKAEQERQEKIRKKKKQQSFGGAGFDPDRDNAFSTQFNNKDDQKDDAKEPSNFYFYNLSASAQGQQDFKRRWGNRILSDDWRRSSVQIQEATQKTLDVQNQDSVAQASAQLVKKDEKKLAADLNRDKYLSTIPTGDDQIQAAELKVDQALFEMGKIYHFELLQDPKATKQFSELAKRFKESENRPESLYLLFKIYDANGQNRERDEIKQILTYEYPTSIFSKLAINPNYREDKALEDEKMQALYSQAYKMYESQQYRATDSLIDAALVKYPKTNFNDNFALLKILLLPKLKEQEDFRQALEKFPEQWPESEMIDYSKTLLAQSLSFEEEQAAQIRGIYDRNLNGFHRLIFNYDRSRISFDSLSSRFNYFLDSIYQQPTSFDVEKVYLDDRYEMMKVQSFSNSQEALDFLTVIKEREPNVFKEFEQYEFDIFVITEKNYSTLLKTKELIDYLDFFDEYYKRNDP